MKTVRVKAIRSVLIRPEDPNDISPEALDARDMPPGVIFVVNEREAEKLVGNGAAKVTTEPISSPEDIALLKTHRTAHYKKLERARLEQIRAEND